MSHSQAEHDFKVGDRVQPTLNAKRQFHSNDTAGLGRTRSGTVERIDERFNQDANPLVYVRWDDYTAEQVLESMDSYWLEPVHPTPRGQTYVVCANYNHFRSLCVYQGWHPGDPTLHPLSTNAPDYWLRGRRITDEDLIIWYGPYQDGRYWRQVTKWTSTVTWTSEDGEVVAKKGDTKETVRYPIRDTILAASAGNHPRNEYLMNAYERMIDR